MEPFYTFCQKIFLPAQDEFTDFLHVFILFTCCTVWPRLNYTLLLLKKTQFLPYHNYELCKKRGTHVYLIFTKFHNDWANILIKAYFCLSLN